MVNFYIISSSEKTKIKKRFFLMSIIGFKFHHAKKDYVLMQIWLSKNEVNKLPHYPIHFVGIGGFVNSLKFLLSLA